MMTTATAREPLSVKFVFLLLLLVPSPNVGAIIFGPPIIDVDIPAGGTKEVTLTIEAVSQPTKTLQATPYMV